MHANRFFPTTNWFPTISFYARLFTQATWTLHPKLPLPSNIQLETTLFPSFKYQSIRNNGHLTSPQLYGFPPRILLLTFCRLILTTYTLHSPGALCYYWLPSRETPVLLVKQTF